MKLYDAIVIGGGPAGISASIYLARFNRSVLVIDKGDGRGQGKQLNENYLGFPKGITAKKLNEQGRKQAQKFGVEFVDDIILKTTRTEKHSKVQYDLEGKNTSYNSRTLVLATGVKDIFPSFPHADKYIGKSIFWCLMCDGWKMRGKKVLVLGNDNKAAHTALKLLNFTKEISFLINCEKGEEEIDEKVMKNLEKNNIPVTYGNIKEVKGEKGLLKEITTDKDEKIRTDYLFSKLGYMIQSGIAQELGAVIESKGFIKVDKDQRTSLSFLYAAGDVTNDTSHQIVTAAHQGAVAGASADEDLLEDFQKE